MNVDSIMNTYNMNSVWNSINPQGNSSSVPLIDNVDSAVNENYTSMNYFGQTADNELQDIYEHAEPDYGIPLTYDKNGNLSIPANTSLPADGLDTYNSNIISLLNSSNSDFDNSIENILSNYNSIENGTFTPDINSILSFNQYNPYSTMGSFGNNSGSIIDTLV